MIVLPYGAPVAGSVAVHSYSACVQCMVTGAAGMLGRDVVTAFRAAGHTTTAMSRRQLDVGDRDAVRAAVKGHELVVNCAAYTAVDDAESHGAEAFSINAMAAAFVAQACTEVGARLVHFSTDYVFDGLATTPYPESAPLTPASAYGRTKAAGEWAVRAECVDHVLLRTAWLYGAHGGCFPKTIARASAERERIDVVDDQVGQPTWTADVADLAVRLVSARVPPGTYHATASGFASWHSFARKVVTAVGREPAMVYPTTTDAFPRRARRPAYSVMGHEALGAVGVEPIGAWDERWSVAAPQVLAL